MRARVAAIVTTYNRCAMLRRCLSSIRAQTGARCDLIIVDNASTDGTWDYLQGETDAITYRMSENGGGAAGFSMGMKLAWEAGYELMWLMDDDVTPEPDALAALLAADARLGGQYGFLYSRTLWVDGSLCRMNRPKISAGQAEVNGLTPIYQASFVSVLFPARTVQAVGLPIGAFFIWGDDVEYTRRIAVRASLTSYWVQASRVIHHTAQNTGSSIALDEPERIDRYFYAYRNERYLFGQEGFRARAYYLLKCGLNAARILFIGRGEKVRRFRVLRRGMIAGKHFRPTVEFVDRNRGEA